MCKNKKTVHCPMLPVVGYRSPLWPRYHTIWFKTYILKDNCPFKLLLGKKGKKKNISPFPATHTYIKLTLVSSPLFFAPFPNYFKLGSSLPYGPLDPSARREGRGTILTDTLLTPRFAPLALSSDGI